MKTSTVARRRFRPWRGIAVVAAIALFSLAGSGVWAYWSAGSGAGGNGVAAATTVGGGATPIVVSAGTTVNLSWAPSTLANGAPVTGYIVKRYNATTLVAQTILTSCTGIIATMSCTESSVPTGEWRYSITPVVGTNWTGAESPLSPVTYTDPTPPVNNLSLSNITGGAALSGTIVYYRGGSAGSLTITNALTDVGSGPASSSTGTLGGASTGWSHTPSTVSTPTGGPYVSNTFSWAAGTTTSPTETVTGSDLANNIALTSLTFVNDSTAPTGTISYTNGYQAGRSVAVSFTGADSGSGLLSGQLQRQSANFRNGGCAAFGAFANIGAANPVSPYTDSTVTNSKCYNYQYVLTDLVGNTFTVTTTNTAWVDYAGAVRYETTGVIDQLRLGDSSIGGNTTAVDSIGGLNPTYTSGVTLGTNGDPQNDPNTAVTLNGTTGWLQDTSPTGLPTGSSSRSVEMWFKTTSTAHQTLFTYGSYANNEEFGLWIDPSGSTLTAWGWGGGDDPTFTSPTTVDDGKWHQVVETYNGTAVSLYVDGSLLASMSATRNTVIDSSGLQIGDVNDASDTNSGFPFNGSLDEFSVYNTALTATDVLNHFQLGANQGTDSTGPTGGSVAASGLVGTGGLYSTSTTLNLALSKGTDTSGVAGSGAYLYRATATLTSTGNADGVCGAFGAFSLVAYDPSASYADTVTDGACYAYRYAVPDVLGNYTTYASGLIKVDATPPVTPSLGLTSTAGYYSAGVLYYRPAAGSSFTLTATSSDVTSGIPTTGYTFPNLGTGWTTTGTGDSRTYNWTNSVTTAGAQTITVTNNASSSSAATFTLTIDSTAPSGGSISYTNTTQTTHTFPITFTNGTDSGSGIGSVQLQRSMASYSNFGGCGAQGTFTTIATNPTSTYSDTTLSKGCWQYRLLVTDHVGNPVTYTSTSVLTVTK
ncbi:MAG TPA: LamG domain-containing protein [Galbitalea sp.]|nr:LamG domain-containing protein [Galbitalea sp.]